MKGAAINIFHKFVLNFWALLRKSKELLTSHKEKQKIHGQPKNKQHISQALQCLLQCKSSHSSINTKTPPETTKSYGKTNKTSNKKKSGRFGRTLFSFFFVVFLLDRLGLLLKMHIFIIFKLHRIAPPTMKDYYAVSLKNQGSECVSGTDLLRQLYVLPH